MGPIWRCVRVCVYVFLLKVLDACELLQVSSLFVSGCSVCLCMTSVVLHLSMYVRLHVSAGALG